jgi:hypothetical protein
MKRASLVHLYQGNLHTNRRPLYNLHHMHYAMEGHCRRRLDKEGDFTVHKYRFAVQSKVIFLIDSLNSKNILV